MVDTKDVTTMVLNRPTRSAMIPGSVRPKIDAAFRTASR